MCSICFPRSPLRTTSQKTGFIPPSNGWTWTTSPAISQPGDETTSPRCYERRIGPDSLNLPGSEKLTSTSPAPTFCVSEPAYRTTSAKPTASTAERGSGGTAHDLPQQWGAYAALGYAYVTPVEWTRRHHNTVLLKGSHVWYIGDDEFWWLGKISASTTEDEVKLVRFLDDPEPIKHPLPPPRYATLTRALQGFWVLKIHIARAFPRWIQPDVDVSRGAMWPVDFQATAVPR